jgi:integrase
LPDAIHPRFRGAIFTAAQTGLRAGELWALKVLHTNVLKRTIHVVESVSETRRGLVTKPPKSGKPRTVTLPRAIAEMMAQQIHDYPSADGFVFTAPKGGQVRHRNFLDDHFFPALDRVDGLPVGFRFHALRHTHASISSPAVGVQNRSRTVWDTGRFGQPRTGTGTCLSTTMTRFWMISMAPFVILSRPGRGLEPNLAVPRRESGASG